MLDLEFFKEIVDVVFFKFFLADDFYSSSFCPFPAKDYNQANQNQPRTRR